MIDQAIRERFEKVRALRDSPNAGERAAAEDRWNAMVAKYGDPDAPPPGRRIGTCPICSALPEEPHIAACPLAKRYETNTHPVEQHFTIHVTTPFGDAPFSGFNIRSAEAFHEAIRAAHKRANADHRAGRDPHRDSEAGIEHARWLGRECGRALTWLMDSMDYEISGLDGGPWTVSGDPDITFYNQQAVIDFARAQGFE